ncbi:MAG TPA: hypothetical protein VHW01_25835 [Polyangiaceae bacterium]|nr:hypothetical protein [Polyangiaceae bacterium]
MSRDEYTQRLTQLGSTIGGYAGSDFSVFTSWSLTTAWDETFGMLVDAFLRPALPAAQLEIDRARQLSRLAHEQERPDERLWFELWNGVYRGHPYEIRERDARDSADAHGSTSFRAPELESLPRR